MSKFIAFYASKPYWAKDALDFDTLERLWTSQASSEFTRLMSEQVFVYDSDLYSLRICRDGLVMVQFPKLESPSWCAPESIPMDSIVSRWNEYLSYINCLYLVLDSSVVQKERLAYLELSEITRKDAFQIELTGSIEKSSTIAMERYAVRFQMQRYLSQFSNASPPHMCPGFSIRPVFGKAVFDLVNEQFKVIAADTNLRQRLALIAKGISQLKVGDYKTGILLAWFAIESALRECWQEFLDDKQVGFKDGEKRINSKRMDKFVKQGQPYTISVITDVLEISGRIPFALFKNIDEVRCNRNHIVHRRPDYVCSYGDCKAAIETALRFVAKQQALDVTPNLSVSVHSLGNRGT